MTTLSNNEKMSKILLERSKINKVLLKSHDFDPTNIGNGAFVSTSSGDVVYDLRLSKSRPFCGHSHPISIQHNFDQLANPLIINFYSVPNNEFTRMIETFQKVHFTEFLDPEFEITYHNVVIEFTEELLDFDLNEVLNKTEAFIENNRDTYFWIAENDINLLSSESFFVFQRIVDDPSSAKHIHLVGKNHFISSVFIQSHHLFSEDSNIQIFLGFKKYIEEVISLSANGKNTIDFKIIDDFLQSNNIQATRIHRYLKFSEPISSLSLKSRAIFTNEITPGKTNLISLPLACTNSELLDILERIKTSL